MYVEWYQDVLCHIIIRPTAIHKGSRNYCCIYRFGKLVVIFGGLHLLVSYLGAVGFIMGGSGLETMWETVYPSGSVIHMMTRQWATLMVLLTTYTSRLTLYYYIKDVQRNID